ncbi:MAG TPA: hypothetical protein VGS08_00305 [Candidatus Saccharimonadales bacterium]|nr:hypothetical protein [Candidatus Saccharimonadales bacterium]
MPQGHKTKISHKAREWSARYLPAEAIATITALVGAFIMHQLSGSLVAAAIGGTIGDNVGYYGYFVIKEAAKHYAKHKQHGQFRRMFLTASKTLRDMLVEFGPAEALDLFIVRPFCMYAGPRLLHNFTVGILVGKYAADAVFYVGAITGYEVKKRYISGKEQQ